MNITAIIATVVAPPLIFFTFLALCVIVSMRKRRAIEAMRHETIRKMMESSQALDSATIRMVLNPLHQAKPGTWHLIMRVVGTILLFIAGGLECMFLWFGFVGKFSGILTWIGIPFLVAMIGAGILYASRFIPPPPAESKDNQGL